MDVPAMQLQVLVARILRYAGPSMVWNGPQQPASVIGNSTRISNPELLAADGGRQ